MARRDLAIKLQETDDPTWFETVRLVAPPVFAPSAGVPVELAGVRWGEFRAPRDMGPGMFELQERGEFREWEPRGAWPVRSRR